MDSLLAKIKNNKTVLFDQFYVLIQFIINTLFSIFTLRLITTNLKPESYGSYRYVLSIVAISSIFIINGFGKTIMGYVAKGYHGTVKKMTLFSVKTGLLGVLTLVIFGAYTLTCKKESTEAFLFFTAAIVFIPYTIFQRYQSVLGGLQKFRLALILRSCSTFFLFLMTVIVLMILKKGVLLFGASNLIFKSVFYTIFFFYSLRLLKNDEIDEGYFNHAVGLSVVLVLNQLIIPGAEIYINHALGGTALAFLVITKSLTSQASGLTKPIMRPISVMLTKRGKTGHGIALLKMVPLLLAFGLLLYGCFYAAIVFLGPLVIDDSYNVCLFYAKILGLIIILSPLLSLLITNVVFEKNTKAYALSQYIEQALLFIGYFALIPFYGIMGIIITNIVTLAVKVLMLLFLVKKELYMNLSSACI